MLHPGVLRRLARPGGRILVAISMVLAAMTAFAAPGSADDYGRNTAYTLFGDRGILPDDAHHTYCVDHVEAQYRQYVIQAMDILDQQTAMTVPDQPLPSCGPQPDGSLPDVDWVVGNDVLVWNLFTDPWGTTVCTAPYGPLGLQFDIVPNDRVCDSSELYVDTGTISRDLVRTGNPTRDAGSLTLNIRQTMCHELGHSVGVEHHPVYPWPDPRYEPERALGLEWGCMDGFYQAQTSCENGPEFQCGLADAFEYLVYVPDHVNDINGYLTCRANGGTVPSCDAAQDNTGQDN